MLEALEIIAESAQTHLGWAITMIGGSLLAIIGTSHHSPKTSKARCIYFMFIPSWLCLGLSVYLGDRAFRNYIAAVIGQKNKELLKTVSGEINKDYYLQQILLLAGILFAVLWLSLYLFWWIVYRKDEEK